jgi:hypothetical protein
MEGELFGADHHPSRVDTQENKVVEGDELI